MRKIFLSSSSNQTQKLAYKVGRNIHQSMLILMSGDLGSGKTTFTQGLAKGLGIVKTVSSPTFTIMKNYKGRINLNHIDAYRLESLHQDLGFEEIIDSNAVTVVEWPDYLEELFPEEYLRIDINIQEGNKREFVFNSNGIKYDKLIEEIK